MNTPTSTITSIAPTEIEMMRHDLGNSREALLHLAQAFYGICDYVHGIYSQAGMKIQAFGADDISRERMQSVENCRDGFNLDAGSLLHMIDELRSFVTPANKLN